MKWKLPRHVDYVMLPNHNLSDSEMDSGAVSKRGMANPPVVSILDSDITSEDWEEDMDKVVKCGKVDDDTQNGGKVCTCYVYGGKVDTSAQNGGKVCIRVGEYASWLRTYESDIVDEYAQHIRTTASNIPLEQWADTHHPELREIWAIVRYRGDI